MMRTSRLQPKLQELQKRHEGNQQKLNEVEMNEDIQRSQAFASLRNRTL